MRAVNSSAERLGPTYSAPRVAWAFKVWSASIGIAPTGAGLAGIGSKSKTRTTRQRNRAAEVDWSRRADGR